MRLCGALLMVLGACYAPSIAPGAPCDPVINNCPTGIECLPDGVGHSCGGTGAAIDAAIDGTVDIDAGNEDPDGDGIVGASDNCPAIANPAQHNEDADALGDVCDPCPVSSTNIDSDGDGVGDDCDPRPTMSGDTLVLFEPFAQGIPAGWTGTSSASGSVWSVANDELVVTSGSGMISGMRTNIAGTSRMTAAVSVVADQVFGTDASIGVVNPYSPNIGGGGLLCSLYQPVPGTRQLSLYDITPGVDDNHTLAWVEGTPYVLSVQRAETRFTCMTVPMLVADAILISTTTFTGAVIGLRSEGTTARFQWLMVVRSP